MATDHGAADDYVFTTAVGGPQDRNNVRQRVLLRSVERANEGEEVDLPVGLTPHSLRRTFASLLFEAGATVPYVMAQLGHADPKVTLSIYAHVLRRQGDTGHRLDALIRGSEWAETGRKPASEDGTERPAPEVGHV